MDALPVKLSNIKFTTAHTVVDIDVVIDAIHLVTPVTIAIMDVAAAAADIMDTTVATTTNF